MKVFKVARVCTDPLGRKKWVNVHFGETYMQILSAGGVFPVVLTDDLVFLQQAVIMYTV